MDFKELTIDGLFHTSALISAISEADLRKSRLIAPQTSLTEGPPADFQKMLAKGHMETPSATVELQFEVGDILFEERLTVMTNLTSPIFELFFLRRNSTILDMLQGVFNFFFFSVQNKHAENTDNTYSNINEQLFNPIDIMIQPGKQTVNHIKSQVHTKNEVTGIKQPTFDLEDNDQLFLRPALTATQNRQITVLINDFVEHPYTVKTGCHIATFSIKTPEPAKHMKPTHPAPLRYLSDTNHNDAIQYVNSILKMIESAESNETNWFPKPQEPGVETQQAQKRKRILQQLIALQKLQQLNLEDNIESRKQFSSIFD